MGKEYTAKTFRSGNSMALRLPKALGLVEGEEVVIAPHADGTFSFWRRSDAKEQFLSLYGAFSPGFMADGRLASEQPERDWSKPASNEAA